MLKKRDRDFLASTFESIRMFPDNYADYETTDDMGRPLDVHIAGRFAVTFWDDFADRHVKIMEVTWADDVI